MHQCLCAATTRGPEHHTHSMQAPPHPPAPACALGLELKASWCRMLLDGAKTVELRRYPLPDAYLNQPVYLLQTPDGCEGRSTLPASDLPAGHAGVCIAGVVVFDGQTRYTDQAQFAADQHRHCVPPAGTPYSWQPGVTEEMWGWHIASVQPVNPPASVPAMRRTLSSWFEVAQQPQEDS